MNKNQRKAVQITKKTLKQLVIKPGLTEKQVAGQIKSILAKHKAKPSFKTIVASGKRSALIHGFASNKRIKQGELVMVDFGVEYHGFRSDITRMFVMGKPTKKQRKLLAIVKMAQAKAVRAVRAGKKCCEIDKLARDHVSECGYGKKFVHSTGHGVGREIHQAPKLSMKNNRRLKVGQVITIEPGIYLKGWGGVRIEDMVLVTKSGCRVLTL
ncbi:MAG: M24 family metallopeptidase [bacterium]